MEKQESGIRKRNRNRNLTNKNCRRFCLESVTNNNCSIKTFHPHIIFIYCYYIFYCRIFCVRRTQHRFLWEFHIRVSVATWDREWMSTPPPFAAFPSQCRQWMKHGTLLRKGTSKNIKVFILFRFTEFEKMLPFYKSISVFVYRSRQGDESIEMWVHVKMWSCCALNLCSSLRRNSMGWLFEF